MTVTAPGAAASSDVVQREDLVTLTIDDIEVSVPKGTLVIRAAELIGVEIPRFCDHPLLDPVGACRQCLVEVPDGGTGRPIPKPQASCTLEVAPGMKIKTQAHLPDRGQGTAREHGVPADQPSTRLPHLRQGRGVPAAEPGVVARLRGEPVHRRASAPTRSRSTSRPTSCSTVSAACSAPAAPGSPSRSRAIRSSR